MGRDIFFLLRGPIGGKKRGGGGVIAVFSRRTRGSLEHALRYYDLARITRVHFYGAQSELDYIRFVSRFPFFFFLKSLEE